jgi:hypothetical protein
MTSKNWRNKGKTVSQDKYFRKLEQPDVDINT